MNPKERKRKTTTKEFALFHTNNKPKKIIKINENKDIYFKKFQRYVENNSNNKYKIQLLKNPIIRRLIIIYIILLYLINQITSKKYIRKIISSNSYEITMKTKGTGEIKILNLDHIICPSRIYLNGDIINSARCNYIDSVREVNVVKLEWDNPLTSTYEMFYQLYDIVEMDLTKFDTSTVNDMTGMFECLHSLTSLDISNFNTKNVQHMEYMFYHCFDLKSINLDSFDTSNVKSFSYMFYDCNSLISINLSHFKTEHISNIEYMFYNNYELTSLDLSNFNTEQITKMNKLFYNCKKLEYINLQNFREVSNPDTENMFEQIPKNAVICLDSSQSPNIYNSFKTSKCLIVSCRNDWKNVQTIITNNEEECIRYCNGLDCYSDCEFYFYYNENNNKYYCTLEQFCPINYNKLISEKKQCIDDCRKDSEYAFEFKNKCHEECPNNISKQSITKEFYCEVICSKEYPFEIKKTQNCVEYCSILDMEKGLCIINYQSTENEDAKEAEEKAIENAKKELKNNFDISKLEGGKKIIINQKYSNIIIRSTDDSNDEEDKALNISKIYLGECEDSIRELYKIPKNKSLYLFQLEIKQEDYQIPKIEYEIYYPDKSGSLIELNLSICENTKIGIMVPVSMKGDIDIDKVNAKSGFYNDICYTYTSTNGTDVPFSARKEEFIKNNLTLCEEDCEFIDYDYFYQKAICSCRVKTNSTFKIKGTVINKEKLLTSFTDIKNIMNIKVLKCINLIFTLDAYKKNYANLILIAIILLYFVTLFIFCFKDYPNLKKTIDMIIFFKTNRKLINKIIVKNKNSNNRQLIDKIMITSKRNNSKKRKKFNLKRNKINCKLNKKEKSSCNDKSKQIFVSSFKNKSNQIKKTKKYSKNIVNITNNNLGFNNKIDINKINSLKTSNKITHQKSGNHDFNIELNEQEIYQNYLKINGKTDIEMNSLLYKEAKKIDNRTYFMYYASLIRTNHLLFFSFFPIMDYNSQILKIFLFFF